jgi:hypothetical protein
MSNKHALRPSLPRPKYTRPLQRGRAGSKPSAAKRVGFAEELEQIFIPVDHSDHESDDAADFDDLFGTPNELPAKGFPEKLEENSFSFESPAQFFAMLNSQ